MLCYYFINSKLYFFTVKYSFDASCFFTVIPDFNFFEPTPTQNTEVESVSQSAPQPNSAPPMTSQDSSQTVTQNEIPPQPTTDTPNSPPSEQPLAVSHESTGTAEATGTTEATDTTEATGTTDAAGTTKATDPTESTDTPVDVLDTNTMSDITETQTESYTSTAGSRGANAITGEKITTSPKPRGI